MSIFYKYAGYYDLIYKDKDYNRECNMIEQIFSKFSDIEIKTILDFGCGTGGHANLLANRGYKVTGVDLSDEMIQIALNKRPLTDNPTFHKGDIKEILFNQEFDAVICMFAVIGYQVENGDLINTFKNACKHLKKGGIFIFDCWYGPAVLNIKPSTRIKKFQLPDSLKLIRYADPAIDINANLVRVSYDLIVIEHDIVKDYVSEIHKMRYFFIPEIKLMLQASGLTFISAYDFENLSMEPTSNTWNILCIVKK